jgi:LysM repeat protein
MKKPGSFFVLLLLTISSFNVSAQDDETIKNYINTYKQIAIEEMQRTGVPASIKLAQGIHETTAGTSKLVLKSNNHFGIKCKSNWSGPSVSHTDDAPNECFRKYDDPSESYRDHSNFLKGSPRYGSLFQLDPMDYSAWAYGLKKAGYATNPKYPQIIVKLIENYHLQDYTMIALNKMPVNQEEIAASTNHQAEKKMETAIAVKSESHDLDKKKTAATKDLPMKRSYPSGEFKINETRVVFVKNETSLLSVAQQFNIPLARIFEFNDMEETETLEKDQLIYLQRKRKTGNSEFHIVREGETLYEIAQEEAIRIEALLEYNQLKEGMKPAAGEQLYLRSSSPGKPRLAIRN